MNTYKSTTITCEADGCGVQISVPRDGKDLKEELPLEGN